ncbi:Endonuclease/exonuclease/phosphatase [Paraphysoderma sedebokerense]|nr:Endonuclease/exonuclease/phosphatase [Paraphysoderma sedebokerense]
MNGQHLLHSDQQHDPRRSVSFSNEGTLPNDQLLSIPSTAVSKSKSTDCLSNTKHLTIDSNVAPNQSYSKAKFAKLYASFSRSFQSLVGIKRTESDSLETKNLSVFIGTWNVQGKPPPTSLNPFIPFSYNSASLKSPQHPAPHILIIGTQENVRRDDWLRSISQSLAKEYELLEMESLGGLWISVWVCNRLRPSVKKYESSSVATGIGNVIPNKGGIGIAMQIAEKSFLFINSHLSAHQGNVRLRNEEYKRIESELKFPSFGHQVGYVSTHFDYVFWFGDLNYRIDGTRRLVDKCINEKRMEVLLANDQLRVEKAKGNAFTGYQEHDINFLPTYKFKVSAENPKSKPPHSSTRERLKMRNKVGIAPAPSSGYAINPPRIPSFTDRILYRFRPSDTNYITPISYESHPEMLISDHKPVSAVYNCYFDWKESDQRSLLQEVKRPQQKQITRKLQCVIL